MHLDVIIDLEHRRSCEIEPLCEEEQNANICTNKRHRDYQQFSDEDVCWFVRHPWLQIVLFIFAVVLWNCLQLQLSWKNHFLKSKGNATENTDDSISHISSVWNARVDSYVTNQKQQQKVFHCGEALNQYICLHWTVISKLEEHLNACMCLGVLL